MADTQRPDYTLNRQEFLDIMGAIKELPRIYKHIEKIEGHIESMAKSQQQDILGLRDALGDVEAMSRAANEHALDALRRLDNIDANSARNRPMATSLSIVSPKDWLNLGIKIVTAVGTFGSILYLLINEVLK